MGTDRPAYRIRRHYDGQDKPKKYQATYTIHDEHHPERSVTCDLIGQAVFSTLHFTGSNGESWRLQPNRKFMPSRWKMKDTNDVAVFHFDQKILGKVINPVYKTVLAILDGQESEIMRLVNLHSKKASYVVGLDIGTYALVKDSTAVAELGSLPREKEQAKGRGLFGKFRRFMQSSDTAIIGLTDDLPLPLPAALAMYLLYKEITDSSGS